MQSTQRWTSPCPYEGSSLIGTTGSKESKKVNEAPKEEHRGHGKCPATSGRGQGRDLSQGSNKEWFRLAQVKLEIKKVKNQCSRRFLPRKAEEHARSREDPELPSSADDTHTLQSKLSLLWETGLITSRRAKAWQRSRHQTGLQDSSAHGNASLVLSATQHQSVLVKVNEDMKISQGDLSAERLERSHYYALFRAWQKQSWDHSSLFHASAGVLFV